MAASASHLVESVANKTKAVVEGYWGPVTATIDWCEANYQFSPYIAEVANTFSNCVTVWFALHGALKGIEHDLPRRLTYAYLGFALVGFGSFAFHATLLFQTQLADELPMIYVATYNAYLLYDTEPGWKVTNRSQTLLGMCFTFDILFTAVYYMYRNPVFHQAVFATIIISSGLRVTYLIKWSPEYSAKTPSSITTPILSMFWTGGALFLLGFGIWNLDNIFCGTLTGWKRVFGWPAAFFLEGHSWWHFFTAAGTYLMMQGISYLTLCVKDDYRKFTLESWSGIPNIARVQPDAPEKSKLEQ